MPIPRKSVKHKAKAEPTLREQIKALNKKVNKLAKQNKLLQEERNELSDVLAAFSGMKGEYHAMNMWTKTVFNQIEDHHSSIQNLNLALNKARERSLLNLKPFRSVLGKLADEGATPVDGNAVNLFRPPIA